MSSNPFKGVKNADLAKEKKTISPDYRSRLSMKIFSLLDLTSLNSTDSEESITGMCRRINEFGQYFPGTPPVAAICVFPRFVPAVRKTLAVKEVNIASVAASFPASQTFIENKVDECMRAADAGADELDIVISLGEFLNGRHDLVASEIESIKKAAGSAHLKVIIESGVIDSPELVYLASMISMEAGADFIKTSTGKDRVSATPEAAVVMCTAIKDFHSAAGRMVGFKPAGGISVLDEAALYYSIVDDILGEKWLNKHLFRIGASRLANNLLSEIRAQETSYF